MDPDSCILIALALLLTLNSAFSDTVLESAPHTDWGWWGPFNNCSAGEVVLGFQLKTEPDQGSGDDTALNGVRFYCGDPKFPDRYTRIVSSFEGEWGFWGRTFQCPFGGGFMNGFQLNVESNQWSGDDTASNNLRVTCSLNSQFIEGDGMQFGVWREIFQCPWNEYFCGLQTQVEPYQGKKRDNDSKVNRSSIMSDDDTALNNIKIKCCSLIVM